MPKLIAEGLNVEDFRVAVAVHETPAATRLSWDDLVYVVKSNGAPENRLEVDARKLT